MILHEYASDAEKLAEQLPQDTAITYVIQDLLQRVAAKGIAGDAGIFTADYPHLPDPDDGSFYVVDQSTIERENIERGIQNILDGPAVAFVAQGSAVRSVLALPRYDGSRPVTNTGILLHELEHLTEKESGLIIPELTGRDFVANHGEREKRAYRINSSLFRAADGSDFERYAESWPAEFSYDGSQAEIKYLDTECPKPPKETLVYDMWAEGPIGKQLLRSIGRIAALEKLGAELPRETFNALYGYSQLGA